MTALSTRIIEDRRLNGSALKLSQLARLVEGEVDRVNRTLSQVEGIKKVALLPRRFYEEEGDVTPTKKVKRRAVEQRYADLIAGLYRD